MSGYDTQQICKKWGHQLTDRYYNSVGKRQKYCQQCGSEAIIKCEYCNDEIRGYYHSDAVIDLTGSKADVPSCCPTCGKSFPWRWWFDIKKIIDFSISPLKYVIDAAVKVLTRK